MLFRSAEKVFIAGRKQNKLDIGCEIGADVAVNISDENLADRIMRETDGKGVNKILETSGSAQVFDDVLDCAGAGCHVTLVGFYEDRFRENFNLDRIVLKKLTISGAAGAPIVSQVMKLMADGKIDITRLITHVFPVEKGVEAFMTANERSASKIKMLVKMTEEG